MQSRKEQEKCLKKKRNPNYNHEGDKRNRLMG